MDFITPALAIGSALFGSSSAASMNRQNLKMAREQMAFQERMSNTEIQRRMRDAEAAGVNPVFALGASGASAPSGASATMGDVGAAGVAAASAATQLRLQTQLMKQTVRKETALADTQEEIAAQQKMETSIRNSLFGTAERPGVELAGREAAFRKVFLEAGREQATQKDVIATINAMLKKAEGEAESARLKALRDRILSMSPQEWLKAIESEFDPALLLNSIRGFGK